MYSTVHTTVTVATFTLQLHMSQGSGIVFKKRQQSQDQIFNCQKSPAPSVQFIAPKVADVTT